jgi:hypothetical protein
MVTLLTVVCSALLSVIIGTIPLMLIKLECRVCGQRISLIYMNIFKSRSKEHCCHEINICKTCSHLYNVKKFQDACFMARLGSIKKFLHNISNGGE